MNTICPHCGSAVAGPMRGRQSPGEVLAAILLGFLGIIPAVWFYSGVGSRPF